MPACAKSKHQNMQDAYDEYDRLEDEALERLRDISAMSDEETDTESEAVRGCITLTLPSLNTEEPSDVVAWMLNLFEQTFEYESGWDAAHQDVENTVFWRRVAHSNGVAVLRFVKDGDTSCCVVRTDEEETIITTRQEFRAFLSGIVMHAQKEKSTIHAN